MCSSSVYMQTASDQVLKCCFMYFHMELFVTNMWIYIRGQKAIHAGFMATTIFDTELPRRDAVHFTCPMPTEMIQLVCNQIGTMALTESHETLYQTLVQMKNADSTC